MKLQLDQKTLNALDASIQHWQDYVEGKGEDYPGRDNCALCGLFYEQRCRGCPVKLTTQHKQCDTTPYRRAVEALYNNLNEKDYKCPEFLLAAKEELDFLISIRENSELKQS